MPLRNTIDDREGAFADPRLRARQLRPGLATVGALEQDEATSNRIRERVSVRSVGKAERVDSTLTNQKAKVTSGTLLSHSAFDGADVVSWMLIAG